MTDPGFAVNVYLYTSCLCMCCVWMGVHTNIWVNKIIWAKLNLNEQLNKFTGLRRVASAPAQLVCFASATLVRPCKRPNKAVLPNKESVVRSSKSSPTSCVGANATRLWWASPNNRKTIYCDVNLQITVNHYRDMQLNLHYYFSYNVIYLKKLSLPL